MGLAFMVAQSVLSARVAFDVAAERRFVAAVCTPLAVVSAADAAVLLVVAVTSRVFFFV